jgi:hypothetical protein
VFQGRSSPDGAAIVIRPDAVLLGEAIPRSEPLLAPDCGGMSPRQDACYRVAGRPGVGPKANGIRLFSTGRQSRSGCSWL